MRTRGKVERVAFIGAIFLRMRSTRVSSTNFTRIVAAKAMCSAARWQPASTYSDIYGTSAAFGPCRQDLIRPFWTI